MAAPTTTAPIKRALVRSLRAIPSWGTAVPGGVHQSLAPRKQRYPFVTYNLLPAVRDYQFDGMQLTTDVDVFAYSENAVDAENVDSLIAAHLQDAPLAVDGQVLLYCRRVADVSNPQTDARGRRIYQIGGTYRITTDQNL
jgi:hypothetical protein